MHITVGTDTKGIGLIYFKALCQVNLLQWPVGNAGRYGLVVTCTKIRFFFNRYLLQLAERKLLRQGKIKIYAPVAISGFMDGLKF